MSFDKEEDKKPTKPLMGSHLNDRRVTLMVTSGNKKIAAEKKSKGKEGGVDTEQVMMNVVGM